LSLFKRRRFPAEIILLCVRWYCKYGISYRDLAEMMQERGVAVDPSTIFRWVQRYAPELEKRVRQHQGSRSLSWRVDETYVRVGGEWHYLFRAVDKVLINGPPQPVFLARDCDHDFIEMPNITTVLSLAPEAASVCGPKLQSPAADRLVGDENAALEQHLLNQPQA
jgi:hypothetical protein